MRYSLKKGFSKKIVLSEIIFLESDTNYTRIYFENGKSNLVSRCLQYLINNYLDQSFVRIHRSYCINKNHFIGFDYPKSPEVVYLTGGHQLSIARRRKQEALALI